MLIAVKLAVIASFVISTSVQPGRPKLNTLAICTWRIVTQDSNSSAVLKDYLTLETEIKIEIVQIMAGSRPWYLPIDSTVIYVRVAKLVVCVNPDPGGDIDTFSSKYGGPQELRDIVGYNIEDRQDESGRCSSRSTNHEYAILKPLCGTDFERE